MSSKTKSEESVNKFKKNVRLYQSLLFLALITMGAMIFLYRNNLRVIKHDPYPLINPLRSSIAQKDFIVNIQPLRDFINKVVGEHKQYDTSIYFEVLNTGANISINPNLDIFPASLAKLPLAMAVAKKVEEGKWKWTNELVLFEQDMDKDSGLLYQKPVGTTFTVESLLRELLVNSDNTAYKILLRNMDASELSVVIDEIGLQELFDKEGKISAKEYSRMFRALYNSSFLKRENSTIILDLLSQSPFDNYLASGLPVGTKFSHKIGENILEGIYSDVGIVYLDNRAYLIAVMVQSKDKVTGKVEAEDLMKTISKQAYEYVQTQ